MSYRGALILAQAALRRWTNLYAHLQNECGEVVSRKLDYNLPPGDHIKALEAIEEALAQSQPEHDDAIRWCEAIVALSAGWDEDGSTGPIPPLEWETVARMAMDYARAAVRNAAPQNQGDPRPGAQASPIDSAVAASPATGDGATK